MITRWPTLRGQLALKLLCFLWGGRVATMRIRARGLPESSRTETANGAEVRAAEGQFATDGQPRLGDLQGRCTGLARPVLHHRGQPQTDHRDGIPIAAGPAPRTGALGRMTSWAGGA